MAPGVYLRALLIGYFEWLDSERGFACRVADSLSLRGFLGFGLNEMICRLALHAMKRQQCQTEVGDATAEFADPKCDASQIPAGAAFQRSG